MGILPINPFMLHLSIHQPPAHSPDTNVTNHPPIRKARSPQPRHLLVHSIYQTVYVGIQPLASPFPLYSLPTHAGTIFYSDLLPHTSLSTLIHSPGNPFRVRKPLGTENAAVAKTALPARNCPVEERDLLQSTTKACEKFLERRKGHGGG